jgi:hypothetical protein
VEKIIFMTAYSKIDPEVVVEVRNALVEFDPDLVKARRLLVPALNLQNAALAGGEKLFRRSWWQAVSSKDFYIWDELAAKSKSYRPRGMASFDAAATAICFFAFAEIRGTELMEVKIEAETYIKFLKTRTKALGILPRVPPRLELSDEKQKSALAELIRPHFEEGKRPRAGKASPEPQVYNLSLNTLHGYSKSLDVDSGRITGFKIDGSVIGPSFLISLLVRGRPLEKAHIRMEIRQEGELLRQSDEHLVTADGSGFFSFSDPILNFQVGEPGWLELRPLFEGKALPSHWQPVRIEYEGPFSSLKELRDQL